MHIFVQHHARGHDKFVEAMQINSLLLILLEINPTLLQQLNGIMCIYINIDVEFPEIEFPDTMLIRTACGKIPILVRKCEAQLNQFQQIHIGSEPLIMELCTIYKNPHRYDYNTRELRVHG